MALFKNKGKARWHRRVRHAIRHSLRWRLVMLFMVLALTMSVVFVVGMQKAFTVGWRDAALPLVSDYVDYLVADLGSPPSIERAQALVQRLPLSVRMDGPQGHWESHPGKSARPWRQRGELRDAPHLLSRTTADGTRVVLGLGDIDWEEPRSRIVWTTLGGLLLLTGVAFAVVRRLLRPLEDIRRGTQRFGAGDFSQPIPQQSRDELGDLALHINTMAHDIHAMLEAKRGLLLAISHELRSPLTRARLNTELLPETADLQLLRDPLLRDLQLMRDLISDLLESERLASPHAALHLEPTDLAALVAEMATAPGTQLHIAPNLPAWPLDRVRIRLLLRNLLDNARQHGQGAIDVYLARVDGGLQLRVRDHGPGVADGQWAQLAEPFYRADAARQRGTGGVGLGLYLCRLVAQAHGGRLTLRPAQPGLEAVVDLPVR
ncbi:HAMP domain-containing sensor histidine kinase [Rhodoferax sp.]|uniref:HAMP domain-containing sensor histidine kinase n=1 Tax=Rhodoferax sp. TaxID=50421 RepID=UPI0025DC9BAD|nr:HAMP domain-containing sensor histidine kinase [Rhodoferax sp.]